MTTRFIPSADGPVRTVDAGNLAHFKQALHEQRRFRIEQLQQLDAQVEAESAPLAEVAEVLRAGAHLALTEVDAALVRMSTGQYGRCVHCDSEISPARLEIVPMAALCMTCQRQFETG